MNIYNIESDISNNLLDKNKYIVNTDTINMDELANSGADDDKQKYNIFQTRYKINPKPIGKGSFATVYHATNEYNEPVAIKKIKIANLRQDRINKFMLELDISYEMKHDNIVKCNEIFKTKNNWYIVLEYCDGPSFMQLIKKIQKLNYNKRELIVKKIMIELKDALYYLRSKNVIHRDLKPDNILLQTYTSKKYNILNHLDDLSNLDNFTIKLADFGFARYFDDQEKEKEKQVDDLTMTICGTPLYMSPEMLINYKYNIKADLWSFGIIMYEAMYGFNPFIAPHLDMKLLTEMIKKTTIKYDSQYSKESIDLLKKLLVVNPQNRISWENFFDHDWFTENNISLMTSKPIDIPHKSNYQYSTSAPPPMINHLYNYKTHEHIHNNTPNQDELTSQIDNVDEIDDKKSSSYTCHVNNLSNLDNLDCLDVLDDDNYLDDFIVVTETDKIDYADMINDRAWKSKNSFKAYESVTGSLIRIVANPLNYLIKSLSPKSY